MRKIDSAILVLALSVLVGACVSNAPRSVPRLSDLRVVAPTDDVPLEARVFSGLIKGELHVTSGIAYCEIWVEKIRANGVAVVTYGCDDPKYGAFVDRHPADIKDGTLTIRLGSAVFSLKNEGGGRFGGHHSRGNATGRFLKEAQP